MQKRGITTFCSNFFVSLPKNFVGEHFGVSENFVYRKIFCIRIGYHYTPLKNLSHSVEKIRRRTLLCFERILVSKIFKQKRGEDSRFCQIFLNLTGPKKPPGNHSVFQKISGREKYFTDKRGGGREGLSRFSVKNFWSQSAEKFRRGTLLYCVSENFRAKKFKDR